MSMTSNSSHDCPDSDDWHDWLDVFSGGVPTGPFFFSYTLSGLEKMYKEQKDHYIGSQLKELCVIGLVSYFEAFCKDHFASIINIEPSILKNLLKNKKDININIDPIKALEFGDNLSCNIGFLVAEKCIFGSVKEINTLYKALILITPFSTDEKQVYDNLLNDRNLLVHHGGTFTSSYMEQNKNTISTKNKTPFFDSLCISREYLDEKFNFIEHISRKILKASHTSLTKYLDENEIKLPEWKQEAIASFLQE